MSDLNEFMKLRYNSKRGTELYQYLGILYFGYVRPLFRSLRRSEEYRIAQDVIRISVILDKQQSMKHLRLTSKQLRNNELLKKSIAKSELTKEEQLEIKSVILNPRQVYVDAVLIVSVLENEQFRKRVRWFISIILTVATTILVAVLKIVGDIYVKLIE